MRYLFLIYLDERASEARAPAEVAAAMASHVPYIELLRRNRQYAHSDALEPSRSARTLRGAGGKPVATEGPFAESREQLGGFYVVLAEDLDAAIEAAARCPALETVAVAIEIRPVAEAGELADAAPPGARRYLLASYGAEDTGDAGGALLERLRASGQLAAGEWLAPSGSATTLRLRGGRIALSDGPFAEGGPQLAAVAAVWARDLDAAADLAAACADARIQAIEIRPIRTRAA